MSNSQEEVSSDRRKRRVHKCLFASSDNRFLCLSTGGISRTFIDQYYPLLFGVFSRSSVHTITSIPASSLPLPYLQVQSPFPTTTCEPSVSYFLLSRYHSATIDLANSTYPLGPQITTFVTFGCQLSPCSLWPSVVTYRPALCDLRLSLIALPFLTFVRHLSPCILRPSAVTYRPDANDDGDDDGDDD